MTLQLSNQPVFMAGQSALKALIGAFVNRTRRVAHRTLLDARWRDMTGAGDLLVDALRLEQEFNKTDLTKAEGDELERWRLHLRTVDRLAADYASAVSRWREVLQSECQASKRNQISS